MTLYIGIRNWSLFLATACTSGFGQHLVAQGPVTAQVSASADHVTIGDHVTLRFTIDHAADAVVIWPDSLPNITPFEQLASHAPTSSPLADQTVRAEATYVVAAFELGELNFPAVSFPVIGASGDTTLANSDAFDVVIATVGLDGSEDIRGIKPPLAIPLSWIVVALWLSVAIAVLVGGWFIYRRIRQRDKPVLPARTAAPPQPAHVIAYEALDRLEQSSMLEDEEIQRWYSEVSQIIRVYIEGRYDVPAMEMASGDIMNGLEPFRLDYRALDQFRDFFERSDLVKFAKHRPSIEKCRQLVESARKLVDLTRVTDTVVTTTTDNAAAA